MHFLFCVYVSVSGQASTLLSERTLSKQLLTTYPNPKPPRDNDLLCIDCCLAWCRCGVQLVQRYF